MAGDNKSEVDVNMSPQSRIVESHRNAKAAGTGNEAVQPIDTQTAGIPETEQPELKTTKQSEVNETITDGHQSHQNCTFQEKQSPD